MVFTFCKAKSSGDAVKSKIISNHQLAEELHKPIIRSLKNKKYTHLLKKIFGVLV